MIWAITYKNIDIVRVLIEKGAGVNAKDAIGITALHTASMIDMNEIIELLINNNADVNAQSNTGLTPLMIASNRSNLDLVRTLLKLGVPVNVVDVENKSALDYALKEGTPEIINMIKDAATNARSSQ